MGVAPYYGTLEGLQDRNTQISQYTALFRADTGIGEMLGMAADLPQPGEPLHIVSAGCSYGVEVDTVLGLAHRYTPGTHISIVGVDSNPAALKAAEEARYAVNTSFSQVSSAYAGMGYDFSKTMSAHGIGVVAHSIHTKSPVLLTGRLRAEHDVTWRQGDLTRDAITKGAAHLILCNNVLCYFRPRPDLADAIAQNLGTQLALGGILSFGANLENGGMDGWAKDVVPKLVAQGLEPLATDNSAQTAFWRVA